MKARVTIEAGTLNEAIGHAREAFREFFGDTLPFIVNESDVDAEAAVVVSDGSGAQRVLAWTCTFTAATVSSDKAGSE